MTDNDFLSELIKEEKPRETKHLSRGQALWNRAKKIIPGGSQLLSKRAEMFAPEQWPAYYKKAKGIKVTDIDDNEYVDMSLMGVGSCILGYADPDVNKAVKDRINRGNMCTLNCPEEVELADKLIQLNPWAGGVRYTRTAGEALAVAVRIARAHTKRDVVAFSGYHGWSDWYLAANITGDNLGEQLLPGLEPNGVPQGLKGTAQPFTNEDELAKLSESFNLAAIVIEPMRHHYPKESFLKGVQEIAKRTGAVLIVDEVTSGWRRNIGGVYQNLNIQPDMAVFGKAMSNGYAMAAVVGKQEVMDAAQTSFISSTYWTEGIGPTAALATINKLQHYDVPEHLCKIGKDIGEGWKKAATEAGLNITVHADFEPLVCFDFNYGDKNQALSTLFTQEMLERGYLSSKKGCYVSYSHTLFDVDQYMERVAPVFRFLKRAIDENRVEKELKGPIAHEGFKRLVQ